VAIVISLFAIRPQRILGGAPDIAEDIVLIKQKEQMHYPAYLLGVAEVTNNAAVALHFSASIKKRTTSFAALFLAFSLISTYILVAYA
jgi:hypothetical protein